MHVFPRLPAIVNEHNTLNQLTQHPAMLHDNLYAARCVVDWWIHERQEMTQKLIQLAHDSKLAPYVSAEFPMSQAKEAFKVLAERRAIGKVCITFNDTKSKL